MDHPVLFCLRPVFTLNIIVLVRCLKGGLVAYCAQWRLWQTHYVCRWLIVKKRQLCTHAQAGIIMLNWSINMRINKHSTIYLLFLFIHYSLGELKISISSRTIPLSRAWQGRYECVDHVMLFNAVPSVCHGCSEIWRQQQIKKPELLITYDAERPAWFIILNWNLRPTFVCIILINIWHMILY